MEAKLNVVLLGVLAITWAAATLAEPAAALDPAHVRVDELASLEDAFAADRADPVLARRLADQYLELRQPQLAVAALSASEPEVRDDPAVLHRLAQAYEETGRMGDALRTARLARAVCGRALGTLDSSAVTPLPAFDCSERTYAALDMHAAALEHLAAWGVTDVQRDPRAPRAYSLAVRSARILSARAD